MNGTRTNLAVFGLLGLCAFGLGTLAGMRVEKLVHRPGSTEDRRSTALHSAAGTRPKAATGQAPNASAAGLWVAPEQALEVFTARVRELDRPGRWDNDVHRLTPLLMTLSTNEYPNAWKLLDGLGSTVLRQRLEELMVGIWSKRDLRGALAAVLAMPKGSTQEQLMQQALWTWGGREPEAALAWAQKLPAGERQSGALASLIFGLAQQDPAAAARLLGTIPQAKDPALRPTVIQRLARTDPEAALGMLEQTPQMPDRDICLRAIVDSKLACSVSDTLAWTRTLTDEGERAVALGAVVSALVQTNPAQAAGLVLAQSDTRLKPQLAATLAGDWVAVDGKAAADWATQLPEGPLRRRALESLWQRWSEQDPEAAVNFALTAMPAGKERTGALASLAGEWFSSEQDEQPVLYAKRLPAGPERDAFLSGLCGALVPYGGADEAAHLAVSISPGEAQTEAVQSAAQRWVLEEPAAASAWGAALSEGPARLAALPVLSRTWADQDAAACDQWLQTLPADEAREKAVEAYIAEAAPKRPDLAARWVQSIPDDTLRNQQIENIARQWLKSNPEAAQNWLQQTALPDEIKARLLGR